MWTQFEKRISRCHPKYNNTPIPSTQLPITLIPVDVQIEGDIIILLCTSNRQTCMTTSYQPAQTTNNISQTLQTQFELLPASLQRICGHVIFPTDNGVHLASAAVNGHLVGVSDGSLKTDIATHAWTLTTGPTDQLALCGCGPIDGVASTLSSFRTEVQGQVALLIMVSLLSKVHVLSHSSFTSVCDNQAALKRLQPSQEGLRLRHHKEPDADLILTFRQWSDNNIHRSSKWVHGHQDSKKETLSLTDNELLNIEMDLLADIAYELPYEMQTQSNQEVLPAEKIAVYLQGNKITSHLKKTIIHACHAPAMALYVSSKHNLNDYDMDHINWNGLKSMMSKQKMNQRAISSKLIHGWLPTNAFLHKQQRTPSPFCPVCDDLATRETSDHILRCPHPLAVKERISLLTKCLKQLRTTAYTLPIILSCWDEAL